MSMIVGNQYLVLQIYTFASLREAARYGECEQHTHHIGFQVYWTIMRSLSMYLNVCIFDGFLDINVCLWWERASERRKSRQTNKVTKIQIIFVAFAKIKKGNFPLNLPQAAAWNFKRESVSRSNEFCRCTVRRKTSGFNHFLKTCSVLLPFHSSSAFLVSFSLSSRSLALLYWITFFRYFSTSDHEAFWRL